MLIKKIRKTAKITKNTLRIKNLIFRKLFTKRNLAYLTKPIPKSVTGRRLIRGRKKSLKRLYVKANYSPSFYRCPFLISNLFFNKNLNKYFASLKSETGIFQIRQTTTHFKLFSYFTSRCYALIFYNLSISVEAYLFLAPKWKKISQISLNGLGRAQYVRANGTFATMVDISVYDEWAILKLPSEELKYFSTSSTCLLGENFLKEHKKLTYDNKRWYRKYKGFGPVVRGVAMNPIDHPHGGNTTSIRFPRTPWGTPAKRK